MKKVLVLDFGGQYNLLVARRVRECGVYCEIKSYRLSMEDIRAFAPDALILTGGPATVFEPNAPMVDKALFEMGIPVLGICYGQQLMMHLLGGQCRKAETREYGKIQLTHTASPLFAGVPETSVCWMSHGVEVERIAPGFKVIATTDGCGFAAVENAEQKLYGVQFHPEVQHTEYGMQVLENFLYRICGFSAEWTMASYLDEAVAECRRQIGDGRVLLALSGGVDSSVAAALLQRAVGDQLTCIFVDHGLLRKDEGDQVEQVMKRPRRSARWTSWLRVPSIPMWWSPAWAERAWSSRATITWVACRTAWISRRSWSRCGGCSRMRCGSWAPSWVCRTSWCGGSPSLVPVWPSALSAISPRKS